MLPIKVPPLGESIVEATVSRWHKNAGDAVVAGDTLVELDTDKITVEVPALKPGVLAKRARAEGDVVHVDDVLGELDETAVAVTSGATAAGSSPALSGAATSSPRQATASTGGATTAPPAQPAQPTFPAQSANVKSSPAARRVAED